MYQQLKGIHDAYCANDKLREIHHCYSTNKCKNFNKIVTKYNRKDGHRCRTVCGKARVFVGVGVDTLGHEEYHRRLFQRLGLTYNLTVHEADSRRDARQKYMSSYRKTPEFKNVKAKVVAMKVRQAVRDVFKDKQEGHTYQAGVLAPAVALPEEETRRSP